MATHRTFRGKNLYVSILLIGIICTCIQLETQNALKSLYRRYKKPEHTSRRYPPKDTSYIEARKYPNLPIEFVSEVKNISHKMFLKNMSYCAPFPDLGQIHLSNSLWQLFNVKTNTQIQLYGAYYDTRRITPGIDVRILTMINRTNDIFPQNYKLYCQVWYDKQLKPLVVSMNKVDYIWFADWKYHKDGMFAPYLLGCSLPKSHKNKIPRMVSLVEKPCDKAVNMLKVIYNKPNVTKEFTVCVKGMDFREEDMSSRLVEWMELVYLMGVDKIYFYEMQLHPKMKKVLNYYERLGKADVRPITLPDGQPNTPTLQHEFLKKNKVMKWMDELIPYNDCFYRNIYAYEYVCLLDIDEIIVPVHDEDKNWHDIMKRIKKSVSPEHRYNSFSAKQVYYLEFAQENENATTDIPEYMHIMSHVFRSTVIAPGRSHAKTFFNTKEILSCHNHWPVTFSPHSLPHAISPNIARTQHYRNYCADEIDCSEHLKNPVKDTRLWMFKDVLIQRVTGVLNELGLLISLQDE